MLAEPGHQQHEEGQQDVEEDLDAEAPGGRDPAAVGVGGAGPLRCVDGVVLEQPVVDPPVAAEDPGHARDDRRDRQHGPVGGGDPEEAAPGVAAEGGSVPGADAGGDERPVEQEGREQEEERHADVEMGDEPAVPGVAEAVGEDRDVDEQDRDRRQPAQRVEEREPGVGARRRHRRLDLLEQLSFAVCTGTRGVPDLIGHRSNPLSRGRRMLSARGSGPDGCREAHNIATDDRGRFRSGRARRAGVAADAARRQRQCPVRVRHLLPQAPAGRRPRGRRRRRADRGDRFRDAADRPLSGAEPADTVGRLRQRLRRRSASPQLPERVLGNRAGPGPGLGRGRGRRPCRARRRQLGRAAARADRSGSSRRSRRPPCRARRSRSAWRPGSRSRS